MTQSNPVTDKYMLCPFQIQMCDQQGGISLATAFFFRNTRRNVYLSPIGTKVDPISWTVLEQC